MGVSNIFDGYNMTSGGNIMSDDYNMIAENMMDGDLIGENNMNDFKCQLYV